MAVGTWTNPNFETAADGTSYKTSLDNAHAVAKRIVDAFAAHEHASFGMQVVIDAGCVFDGVTLTEVAQQTISSIPAPSSNPRIDRIVIDQLTGVATRVAGSEAASPAAPAIPAGKNPCCKIALSVSQTNIVNANITDERIGGGGVSATREATFAVSIASGEDNHTLKRIYIKSNTTTQIVVRVTVDGFTGGGGKGSPATQTTVGQDYTVTHNLGVIQMVTPSLAITSTLTPFTGTLKVHYK